MFALLVLAPLANYSVACARNGLGAATATATGASAATAEGARLSAILSRTLVIAFGAAALSVAFGVIVFVALHPLLRPAPRRARAWIAAMAAAFAAAPILIPGHFLAIAWIQTAGQAGWLTAALRALGVPAGLAPTLLYSPLGCMTLAALRHYPIALAALWVGWRATGAAPIECASTLMPPGRLWRGLLFGWLRLWLAIGGLAVFVLCLLDYSIPDLLRQRVFTTEIMMAYSVYYDAPRAMALSVPLMALSLVAAGALGRLLARVEWPAFAAHGPRLPALSGGARYALIGAAAVIVGIGTILPIASFVALAGALSSYGPVLKSSAPQAMTSLLWSGAAAGAMALLAGGLLAVRWPWLFAVMVALFALPGSVVGMAHIAFWNAPAPLGLRQALYDSGLLLPLGALTLFLPLVYLALWARLRQTPRALLDGERLAGDPSARRRLLLIAPPLMRPAWLAATLGFILAFQELHASILLAAPGQETLAIRAFTLLHYAPDRLVAAFCVFSLAALAAGVTLIAALRWALVRALKHWMPHVACD